VAGGGVIPRSHMKSAISGTQNSHLRPAGQNAAINPVVHGALHVVHFGVSSSIIILSCPQFHGVISCLRCYLRAAGGAYWSMQASCRSRIRCIQVQYRGQQRHSSHTERHRLFQGRISSAAVHRCVRCKAWCPSFILGWGWSGGRRQRGRPVSVKVPHRICR